MAQDSFGNNLSKDQFTLLQDRLNSISEYTYKTLGFLLFAFIPDYKTEIDDSETKVGYFFMYDFATTLVNKINQNNKSEFVINAFKFINGIGQSTNQEVLNILKVGILEVLFSSNIQREFIAANLNENVRRMFYSFSDFYV